MPFDNSYGGLPPSSFQRYGIAYNQPAQNPYGSTHDLPSTNMTAPRAPLPPPRAYNYSPNSYNSLGYYRNLPSYNRPFYNGSYPSYYQPGSYGIGPNSYGMSPTIPGSSFIEEAQESSREAFSSIEGVVNAFSSINMMVESTYCALQSSFNAVLAVAENLSRLKLHVGQILSAFTLIRSLQWIYRKLLHLIGLRKFDPASESAWKEATNQVLEEGLSSAADKKRSWPVIMFFIAVYAGPFLMWKFINSLMRNGPSKDDWTNEKNDKGQCYYAVAKYGYQARTPEELSFNVGDLLKLAPVSKQKDKNWPLASNGRGVGTVPINYIDIKLNKGNKNDCGQPITTSITGLERGKPTDKSSGQLDKVIGPTQLPLSNASVTHQENTESTSLDICPRNSTSEPSSCSTNEQVSVQNSHVINVSPNEKIEENYGNVKG